MGRRINYPYNRSTPTMMKCMEYMRVRWKDLPSLALWFGSKISPKGSCVEAWCPMHQRSEVGLWGSDWSVGALMSLVD
jgi:hypothetical protein